MPAPSSRTRHAGCCADGPGASAQQPACVRGFLPARNVAPTPRTDYEVDPQSLFRALSWEDEGDELIAIFHSHPASPSYPSMIDVARAHYPDSVYLILSLANPESPVLKGFRILPETIFPRQRARALRKGIPFQQVRPGLWAYRIPPDSADAGKGDEDFYLVFDQPDGPIRLMLVRPVDILLQL